MTDALRFSRPAPLSGPRADPDPEDSQSSGYKPRLVFGKRRVIPTPGADAPFETITGRSRAPEFTMAFQPIADMRNGGVFAYEAFVRGPRGESAASVLDSVPHHDFPAFDALCRRRAIGMARAHGLTTRLSLNISPEALCDPHHGVHGTIQTARDHGFPEQDLILEITERSVIPDLRAARAALATLRSRGALVALDDFGAGYNGLTTLVHLRPDIVKIDIVLINGIDRCEMRQAILASLAESCAKLGILVLAEGVETSAEARTLRLLGIELMQGFLFSVPVVGALVPLPPHCLPDHVESFA